MPAAGDSDGLSRRDALAASVAAATALAGCATSGTVSSRTTTRSGAATETTRSASTTDARGLLRVGASGTVTGVVARAAAVWNANPATDVWWPLEDTDLRLADYFAVDRGLDPTDHAGQPPFQVVVADQRNPDVAADLDAGRLDVVVPDAGDAAATVNRGDAVHARAVARTGCAFVVSPGLRDAVSPIDVADIRACYTGRVSNWAALGGPDRPIWVVTTADAQGSDGCVRRQFDQAAFEGVDQRFGQSRRRLAATERRDDVLADVRVGTSGGLDPVALAVDGRTVPASSLDYPTVYGVFAHTRPEPRPESAAFVDFLRSEFVQREFVAQADGLARIQAPE